MMNKKYIIKKGESGLYNLYKKVGSDYKYKMSFIHYDIAVEACHLLNLEAKSFDGLRHSLKMTTNELNKVQREFFEYRLEHPEEE